MNRNLSHLTALAALSLLIVATGCSDRAPTGLETARAPIDPLVFDDDYNDVYFQAFYQTNLTAVSMDSVFAYEGYAPDGSRSLKVHVAPVGSALGAYSGGVLTATASRDLADYNALTFYARASEDIHLNTLGFGNDNTGTSLYEAGREAVPIGGEWTFVVIPIPDSSRLVSERGMFTFAEGAEEEYPDGYDVWFDEIRFAKLGNIEIVLASLGDNSGAQQYFVGSTVGISGTYTVFRLDGALTVVQHSPGYFAYTSSDASVARVAGSTIEVLRAGTANVTATVQETAVRGALNLTVYEPPTVAAAPPTLPAANVISMFSDAYADVPVDTWNTMWGGSLARVQEYRVAGDNTLMYTNLNFVGVEFLNPMIDASAMTHFHLDVYAPAGTDFKVKLICFPEGGEASIETADLVFTAASTPAFAPGAWSSLDIPLADFQLPAGWDWAHVGQLAFSTTNARLVLVDNVYWHD